MKTPESYGLNGRGTIIKTPNPLIVRTRLCPQPPEIIDEHNKIVRLFTTIMTHKIYVEIFNVKMSRYTYTDIKTTYEK